MRVHANSPRGTLIAVAVIIAGGVVVGLLAGRGEAPPAPAAVADGPMPDRTAPTDDPSRPESPAATAPQALSEPELARLAEATLSGPREARLAAIRRLSELPREQALPPLERVLLNGEPGVDRPAALLGLRELALAQGDGDERIRDAVRTVIYHGDDDSFAAEAQETLDIIAEAEATQPGG